MTRASVIIVCWNGEAYLPDCLDAVLTQVGPNDEVIVVDNGSIDGSAALTRACYPRARLIENGRNLGFGGGCNVGLRAAQGESLILINQDVVLRPGCLDAMLQALAPPDVGIVGCKLLYPDGTIQHAGGFVHYPLALSDHFGYCEPDRGQWDAPRDVEYVTGAAMAIKRTVLERIGLFDEGFFPAFYEETDLCARARTAGYRVVYAPHGVALHHEATTVDREKADYYRWVYRGRLRFVLKHYTPDQFHSDFVPAEREWQARLSVPVMRQGLRMAYLDTLLGLREMPRTGVLVEGGEEAVAEALMGLHAALAVRKGAPEAAAGLSWRVEERPFVSRVPLIGPLIARFRELWNSIATKWYVRPLIEQQNAINRQVIEGLLLAQESIAALDREIVDARRLHTQAIYRLYEELDRLQARVAALEAQLESPTETPS